MAIPWVQILRWTPQILSVSRDLLQRSRRNERAPRAAALTHVDDRVELRDRLAALEQNERQQAELVEQMAEQQAAIARALETLHERQRTISILLGMTAALAVIACAAAAWLALR